MALRVLIEDRTKKAPKAKIKKIAGKVLSDSGFSEVELSVLITSDADIRDLNRKFRGIDKATDVLSFPMDDPVMIGDVAISLERAGEQASAYGAGLIEELARLIVHGTLHLLGYDHVNGGRQAAKMKRREDELLDALKRHGLL